MFEKVLENYKECGTDDEQGELYKTGMMNRVFDVMFEDAVTITNKQVYALTASAGGVSVPELDSVHPADSNWVCRRRSARPGNGPLHWRVLCTYEYSENPLTKAAQVEFLFAEHPEPIDVDRSGNAIVNSSREPLDPPLEKPFNDLLIRIVQNESFYDPLIAAQYIDRVNDNYVLINGVAFPPYTIKINEFNAKKFIWAGVGYYEVNYEFVVRYAVKPGSSEIFGHRRRILDQGLYELDGSSRTRITDDNGDPIVTPVLLDGSGGVLASAGTPYYHYWEVMDVVNFSIFIFRW
jgi:hypothetical protein